MAGTLSRADLVASLKASLHEAADPFKLEDETDDSNFIRLLDVAAADFGRVRPRKVAGELALQGGLAVYPAPAGFVCFHSSQWGAGHGAQPWNQDWPGRLPRCEGAELDGVQMLVLTPAPTHRQVGLLGSRYPFLYEAAHQIGETAGETTIAPADRGLLILRAQAEAMRELSIRNVTLPVAMRDGVSNQPRNGTPSHLYTALMAEFEGRAR